MKIELWNTFNSSKISSHRTVEAAVAARIGHSKAVERTNGPGSYTTYAIRYADGSPVEMEACMAAEESLR